MRIASVEVCRHRWSCILQRPTSTHNYPVSDWSGDWSTSDHSNRSWTTWQGCGSCSGLTQLVRIWESLACLQLCSGSPVAGITKALFLYVSCSMTEILFSASLSVFGLRMLGRGSSAAFFAAVPWEGCCLTHPTLNTSSTGSNACSRGDRFGKHFRKCRNREGHVKAPVLLPKVWRQMVLHSSESNFMEKTDSQFVCLSQLVFWFIFILVFNFFAFSALVLAFLAQTVGQKMRSITWNRFFIKHLLMDSNPIFVETIVTWI